MRNIIMLLACLMDFILVIYCIFSKTNRTKVGLLCGVLAFILLIATFYLLLFPNYKKLPTTGQYKVATKVISYNDESRTEVYAKEPTSRKIVAEIWYPDSEEVSLHSCPLILFSHGSFGTRYNNESMYCELASHGYVVCSVDHLYHSFSAKDENGKKTKISFTYLNELMKEDAKKDPQGSYQNYQKWMGIRMGDINYVIDSLIASSKDDKEERVYQLIDSTKIGIAGHSMGGSAALGIGRQRDDIGAVIALESPFMYDIIGAEDGKLVYCEDEYPTTVLNVYTDSSYENLTKWPQYVENAKMLADDNPSTYNVYLEGVHHLSICDLALTSPFLTRVLNGSSDHVSSRDCLNKLNKMSLEFFDATLKGKGSFHENDWK